MMDNRFDRFPRFITEEQQEEVLAETESLFLELEAGEAVLLHNHTLHRSGSNRTVRPRRTFSVCYMDAATVVAGGKEHPVVFGEGALEPASSLTSAQAQ